MVRLHARICGKLHPDDLLLNTADECLQLYGSSCGASSYFAIWLKAENFSVADRNIIPTGTNLISAFCVVLVRSPQSGQIP